MTEHPISLLRRRMIEGLAIRTIVPSILQGYQRP